MKESPQLETGFDAVSAHQCRPVAVEETEANSNIRNLVNAGDELGMGYLPPLLGQRELVGGASGAGPETLGNRDGTIRSGSGLGRSHRILLNSVPG